MNSVAVNQRAIAAAARRETFSQHADDGIEILACQLAVRPRAPQSLKERRFFPIPRRHLGHDLLRQHVERPVGDCKPIKFPATNAVHEGRAFNEVVAGEWKQPPLRGATDRMAGAADALQEACDRARRTELADEIDVSDVDAEFERSGGDEGFQLAVLEPLLCREPLLLRHAAVMRGDRAVGDPFRQFMGDALRHAAGVDEHERGAVRLDQIDQAIVDLLPDFAGHDRLERRVRNLNAKLTRPLMADVDDLHFGRRRAVRGGSHQQMRDRIDRVLCRRKPDAHQPIAAEVGEPLERQRQVGAAFVRCCRVNFIDDHRPCGRQHLAAGFRAKQDVERFRRRHHDMGRAAAHALAFGRRRIAGPYPGADLDSGQSAPAEMFANAGQRHFQIAVDIVRQRLEGRHIDNLGLVGEMSVQSLANQAVDGGEERSQGFAGTRRGGDQRMLAGLDRRPRIRLRGRRRGEAIGEPGRNRGMEHV